MAMAPLAPQTLRGRYEQASDTSQEIGEGASQLDVAPDQEDIQISNTQSKNRATCAESLQNVYERVPS